MFVGVTSINCLKIRVPAHYTTFSSQLTENNLPVHYKGQLVNDI
jgi:hypothetical protein